MPDFLNRIELEAEGLSERLLRQPCINSDAKLTERQLQQCESSRRVEMIEHPRKHLRRVHLRRGPESVDRVGDSDGGVVDFWLALELRPQQRHRLGGVADII